MIFDTHAHYDDEDFDGDRQALLEGLSGAGVRAVTNIGAVSYTHLNIGQIGIHPLHHQLQGKCALCR